MDEHRPFGFVYFLRNRVNGKIYVGVTTKGVLQRFAGHCESANSGGTSRLYSAMRKYGTAMFVPVQIGTAMSKEQLFAMERRAIACFGSNDSALGYNMTNGGEGLEGYVPTSEMRALYSKASVDYWANSEERRKASERQKARWQDPNYRSAMITKRKEVMNDPVVRARNSEAQLNPEVVARKSAAAKKQWQDPAFQATKSAQALAWFAVPENKEAFREVCRSRSRRQKAMKNG